MLHSTQLGKARTFIVLACTAILAAACSSSTSKPSTTTSAAKGPIKIGVPVALTGELAGVGQADAKIAKLYAAQINADGGINGRKIDLIIMDTKSSPTTGVLDVRQLILQDHVVGLLGISATTLGEDMLPIIKQYKIPTLADIGGGNYNNPAPPYFFDIPESASEVARIELGYMKEQGITRLAWTNGNNGFAEGGLPKFEKVARSDGISLLNPITFSLTANSPSALAPIAERIKSVSGAQAVLIYGVPPADLSLQVELHALGISIPIYQNNAPATSALLKEPASAIDGTILVGGNLQVASQLPKTDPQLPAIKAFLSLYGTTNRFAGDMYDAMTLLVDAIKAVGTNGSAINNWLNTHVHDFPGVTGIITFTPNIHDGISPASLDILKVVNGKFTLVETGAEVLAKLKS